MYLFNKLLIEHKCYVMPVVPCDIDFTKNKGYCKSNNSLSLTFLRRYQLARRRKGRRKIKYRKFFLDFIFKDVFEHKNLNIVLVKAFRNSIFIIMIDRNNLNHKINHEVYQTEVFVFVSKTKK